MTQVKTILLIDDDDDLRAALAEQFVMTEEFSVVEAGTGADALTHVKNGLFDLLIIDVGLPDASRV